MRISEYIKALDALQTEHGDLEVETRFSDMSRVTAKAPEIAYRKILRPRERKNEFWYSWFDDEGNSQKGAMVVRV